MLRFRSSLAHRQQDPHNPYDNVDAYGLLNVYAGVRSNDGAWEVALFAKNVTKTQEQLGVDNGPAATNFQPGGRSLAGPYMRNVRYPPPCELGVNVRYAFGSR